MKVSDITVFLSIFEAACKCSVCVKEEAIKNLILNL